MIYNIQKNIEKTQRKIDKRQQKDSKKVVKREKIYRIQRKPRKKHKE